MKFNLKMKGNSVFPPLTLQYPHFYPDQVKLIHKAGGYTLKIAKFLGGGIPHGEEHF